MMTPPLSIHTDYNAMAVFLRSVVLVGIAELFDKTWFMGLLMALKYDKVTVFMGSFLALFVHCFLAAAFGLAFAKFLSQHILHYLAAGLFAFFAVLYSWDLYQADPDGDAIQTGKEEAEESVSIENKDKVEEGECTGGQQLVHTKSESMKITSAKIPAGFEYGSFRADPKAPCKWVVFGKCFVAVFIAEWGDRTQFAMIGQHASQPLVPVFAGSVLAFFLLTLSAVLVASVLKDQRLSERLVHAVGAIAFAVFAVLSFRDALNDQPAVIH